MMASPTILHEDDQIIAVAKPAGLATANVPAGEESLFTELRRMLARRKSAATQEGEPFLGVVSRLDKPVSGVVVLAKTRSAAASLAGQFRDRSIEKSYVALVEGRFPAPLAKWVTWRDTIDRPGPERERRPHGRGSFASTVKPLADDGGIEAGHGRPAEVEARVVRRAGEVSIVELRPVTGRRHQLRAQLAAHGCPIVGDRMYKARLPFPSGIALHAREIAFDHPSTGVGCRIVADFPEAWRLRFAPLIAAIPSAES